MGTYVYTLRKQAINLHHDGPDGEMSTQANLLKYSYKEWLTSSFDGSVERRREFIRNSASRTAWTAWEKTEHRLVVITDKPQDGDAVYADLEGPVWYDTDQLRARLVGYLQKRHGRWYLVDAAKWERRDYGSGMRHGDEGRPDIRWSRYRAVQGKAVLEEVAQADSNLPDYEQEARWEMYGQDYPQIVDPREQVEIPVVWC